MKNGMVHSTKPLVWLGAPSAGGLALPDASPTTRNLYAPRGVWLDERRLIVADSGNAVAENDDWDEYHQHRKEQRHLRLYASPISDRNGLEQQALSQPDSDKIIRFERFKKPRHGHHQAEHQLLAA